MTATKLKLDTKAKARLEKLGNRYWRLNHLYYILNEQGERILFEMKNRPVLDKLYFALWWLNIIPKSRQHGVTTFLAIFMLDGCLFNSNIRAGIIAHKLLDGKRILKDKIKYAYNNLPADLKAARELLKDDTQEIVFNNNSSIYVDTSMRSGTLQLLHVSEYAWTCTHASQKASEIKSGAMETVHKGGMTFIESTYEGSVGDFPEMCTMAEDIRVSGKELGPLDYKIHFFAWHEKPENVTDPRFVEISQQQHDYFDKLEKVFIKEFTLPQRAWHVAKKKILKHLMYKEHPSTLEEARIAAIEGAFFAVEMAEMRENGRICRVLHNPRYPVHTVCDLGVGGNMPWIFFQIIGLETHIINSFNLGQKDDVRGGAVFYKGMLDDMRELYKYNYGKYFCPFDINKGEIGTGKTIYETFKQHGIIFVKLERELSVLDGIERMTNMFSSLWIDSEKCQELITAWSSYRREWDESAGMFNPQPMAKQQASHYTDAGRYMSKVIEDKLYVMDEGGITTQQIKEWNAKYRRVG